MVNIDIRPALKRTGTPKPHDLGYGDLPPKGQI